MIRVTEPPLGVGLPTSCVGRGQQLNSPDAHPASPSCPLMALGCICPFPSLPPAPESRCGGQGERLLAGRVTPAVP